MENSLKQCSKHWEASFTLVNTEGSSIASFNMATHGERLLVPTRIALKLARESERGGFMWCFGADERRRMCWRDTFVCRRRFGPVLSEAFTKCAYVRSAMWRVPRAGRLALPIYNDGLEALQYKWIKIKCFNNKIVLVSGKDN